jgi:hypothetical protein
MTIEPAKIGTVAAGLMDQLEQYGDDATIDHVMVIAAVDYPGGDTVHYAVSEPMSNYVGIGLLRTILVRLEGGA